MDATAIYKIFKDATNEAVVETYIDIYNNYKNTKDRTIVLNTLYDYMLELYGARRFSEVLNYIIDSIETYEPIDPMLN